MAATPASQVLPTDAQRIRLAIVTNIPAPYRVPVYDRIAADPGIELTVLYSARTEPDRHWDLTPFQHPHRFLTGLVFERAGRYIHFNFDVWRELARCDPHVVMTTGYNPTHLLAYLFAMLRGRRHVAMTDGTDESEARLSALHRLARRVVLATSACAVVASEGGRRLLRSYGVPDSRIHSAPLCANTAVSWTASSAEPPDIDLLFSGRLVEVKNAGFALQVAQLVAQRLRRRVRLAVLGSGPLESALRQQAAAIGHDVEVLFAGHVSQADVPRWLHRARLFVFPTRWDPWGVVANEACLAGVPVLVSPHAGVAGELVLDGVNGRVLALDLEMWVDAAVAILESAALHARLAAAARAVVAQYNFDNAASGIIDAAHHAMSRAAPPPRLSRFKRRARVVCVQRRLPHYRVALFEALRSYLRDRNVDFVLVHGQATPDEEAKNDSGHLAWALQARCRCMLGGRLCWQDPSQAMLGADLAIVTQENRMLYNLLAMTLRRPPRLAYWDHGRNFQSQRPDGIRERVTRWTTRHVDWWFAYTDLSARLVAERGVPIERITTLDNTIDTSGLAAECRSVTALEINDLRARWQLGDGPIGLSIGSLYAEKRLPMLLEAAAELARRVPGFHLVVVGDGPEGALVQAAASRHAWIRHLGVRFGRDKAVCLRAARIIMNPGLVGLGILDSFAAGVPLVTTDCGLHSPEVAYLRNGQNGLMTADSAAAFTDGCESLLRDPEALARLGGQAAADASRYTVAHMTRKLGDGILAALELAAR